MIQFANFREYDDDSLTLDKLRRAIEDAEMPRWVRMIREAKAVEVRATAYIEAGKGYVLDPRAIDSLFRELWADKPTMVVCRPEDEELVRSVVAQIREQQPEHDG